MASRSMQDIMDEVNGIVKEDVLGTASDPRFFHRKVSSGSHILDDMLDGGYRLGRMYQLYGQEGVGKTFLVYLAIANHQAYARAVGNGKKAAFLDVEGSFDPEFAEACGVDVGEESLLIGRSESGDGTLDTMDVLLRTKEFQVIGCDSVAALVPAAELGKRMHEKTMGEQAQLMSRAMRKLTPWLGDCSVFFINQVREKIGVMYGNPMTTPGGKALNFYSSLNLELKRGGVLKGEMPKFDAGSGEWTTEEQQTGHEIKVKSTKDKTGSRQGRTCSLWFKSDTKPPGIEEWDELWIMGLQHEIVNKAARTYTIDELDWRKAGSRDQVRNEFKERDDLQQHVKERLTSIYANRASNVTDDIDSSAGDFEVEGDSTDN